MQCLNTHICYLLQRYRLTLVSRWMRSENIHRVARRHLRHKTLFYVLLTTMLQKENNRRPSACPYVDLIPVSFSNLQWKTDQFSWVLAAYSCVLGSAGWVVARLTCLKSSIKMIAQKKYCLWLLLWFCVI